MRDGLKSLLQGSGPLAIAPNPRPGLRALAARLPPRLDEERWEQGARSVVALNGRTLELFDAYAADGVEFEMHRSGLLLVATDDGLEPHPSSSARCARLGFEGATTELEPAPRSNGASLSPERIVGAVHAGGRPLRAAGEPTDGLAGGCAPTR